MRTSLLILLLFNAGHFMLYSPCSSYAQEVRGEVDNPDRPDDPDDPRVEEPAPVVEEPVDLEPEDYMADFGSLLAELEDADRGGAADVEEALVEFHGGDGAPIQNHYHAPDPDPDGFAEAADEANVLLDDSLPPWGGDPRIIFDRANAPAPPAAYGPGPAYNAVASNQYVQLPLLPDGYGQLDLLPPGVQNRIFNAPPALPAQPGGNYVAPPAVPAERGAQRQAMIIRTIAQIYPPAAEPAEAAAANNAQDSPGFFRRLFNLITGGPRNGPRNEVERAAPINVEVTVQIDFQNLDPDAPAWDGNQALAPQVFVNVRR